MANTNKQLENIIAPIGQEMAVFEDELKNIIFKEENFLSDSLYSYVSQKAKRLRVIFIYLFSKILNVKNDDLILKIALISEIIHNASLLHDDILDEDTKRRGHKTFNLEFNSKSSVLEGDFLLGLALKVLSDCPSNIIQIFTDRILRTIQGELSQQKNNFKIPKLEEYYSKSFEKTGNLFMAGLESLFEICSANNTTKESLKNYLYNFCLMFQIRNDINDFKHSCSDFKNGNFTLPLILYYNKYKKEPKEIPDNIEDFIKIANENIEELNIKSISYLKEIKEDEYKNALLKLNCLVVGE